MADKQNRPHYILSHALHAPIMEALRGGVPLGSVVATLQCAIDQLTVAAPIVDATLEAARRAA